MSVTKSEYPLPLLERVFYGEQMVTHRKEWQVQPTIYVTPRNHGGAGAWEVCTGPAALLPVTRVRRCEDLPAILETEGGMVARLLEGVVRYAGFRLIARETISRGLVGLVEWRHDADSGLWRPHDVPWTVCDSGQHRPGRPELGVAA
ncbi:hypothetical protein [Kitasatospora sp. NPDC001095]